MTDPKNSVPDAFDYDDGWVAAGRATGRPIPPPSEEDLRLAEKSRNDPAFYEFVKDEPSFVSAGFVRPWLDPNRSLVPSGEEIAKLPGCARAAFATRCAHRVLPIVRNPPPGISEHCVETLNKAAARASLYTSIVAEVAGAAAECLLHVVTVGTLHHLATLARDFDWLCQLAEKKKWTDDTPVPQSVFGPMWEGPPPEWWTDDVLAGLPAEPATETNTLANGHPAPTGDAVARQ